MQTGDTARQEPRSVLKKREKLRVLIVKSTFLRIISPSFLALGLFQNDYQSDVRGSKRWVPGSLVTPDSQARVIWKAGIYPDIYPGIET